MSRKKSTPVVQGKKDKSRHCGTITVEDQLRMDRAARRQAQIDSGHNTASGTGPHGGNKRQKRRKDRREGKATTRGMDF